MAELTDSCDTACCGGGTLDLGCGVPAALADVREGETVLDLESIDASPRADASVDVVVSDCVSNLAGDKARAFAEAARVLRPDGRLVACDVLADPDMDEATRAALVAHIGCIGGALTREAFSRGLTDAGFADIEITETHRVHEQAGSTIIRARRA